MKVRRRRLLGLLEDHGFTYGPESRTSDDLIFTRPSPIGELYESIIVGCQGKRDEAVYANVGVSVIKQVAYKVLGDVHHLLELDENKIRNWTIIEDDGKARQWEIKLAEIGSDRAKEWAETAGPRILNATQEVRLAVGKYLIRLGHTEDLETMLLALKDTTIKKIADDAERLYDSPYFRDDSDTEQPHRIACYAVLRYSEEVEGLSFFDHNPIDDQGLQHRILLLVDKLRYQTR